MEEKVFDLLEKMYIEFSGRFDNIENDIKDIQLNMATKEDLNLLGTELHTEIQAVHDEVREIKVDINKIEKIVAKNTYDIEKLKLA